jgi:hypothetical protein
VWFLDLKFLYELAAIDKELQIHHTKRGAHSYCTARRGDAEAIFHAALKPQLEFQ